MLTESAQESLSDEMTPAAMLQMALWHARAGDAQQAERCYRKALEREPANVAAMYRLATLLRADADRLPEALQLLDDALSIDIHNAALHSGRAVVLNRLERPLDALDAFADAVCRAPNSAEALYNLGLQFTDLCSPAQAELYARHLIAQMPDWPVAHYLLLRALTALDADPVEIDALYNMLIKADPLNLPLRFARGLQQLKLGDYAAGWEAQEWRWAIEPVKSSRLELPRPRWAGGPLEGRRLLITGEQGFGDILQFARYLPPLVAQSAQLILQLDDNRAPLARLLACIDDLEIVIGRENLPPIDLHCPLASLPFVFDTMLDTIPAPPYLQVKQEDVDAWKQRLAHLPRPWIGLCWAGSTEHSHDARRSLPLSPATRFYAERQAREQRIISAAARVGATLNLDGTYAATVRDGESAYRTMEPLLRRTAGSFISLQVGPRAADINELPADLKQRITAPLPAQADFYDTACLIQALDQVITVDTSVAHIAGAIGQRGIIIVPAAPEWRWIERDGKSPWYPQMRLMRQHMLASPAH
jgi:hypothetical protein